MKLFSSCLLFLVLVGNALSQELSSTPTYYLQKSEAVVVGTFLEPVDCGINTGPIPRPDIPQLSALDCKPLIRVDKVIKGNISSAKTFRINMTIWYVVQGESKPVLAPNTINQPIFNIRDNQPKNDAPFGYKKGQKYIFFLRPVAPTTKISVNGNAVKWETVDPWFGALPYNDALVLELQDVLSSKSVK